MEKKKKVLLDFLIPIGILLIISPIFWITNLDIGIETLFYRAGEGFYLEKQQPWHLIYKLGPKLAYSVGFTALVLMILSYFMKTLKKYRKITAFTFLLLFVGPGLIVNSVLKDYWGRPRPRHIIEFGGTEKFVPVAIKGPYKAKQSKLKRLNKKEGAVWNIIKKVYKVKSKNNSFPSGHASIAFYFIFPFFFFRGRDSKKAGILLACGLAYGFLMGITRNIQGGHFPSDVIWSGALVYLTGASLFYILKMDKNIWYEKE